MIRPPRLWEALIPVILMIFLLGMSVVNVREIPEMPVLTPILEFLSRLPILGSLVEAGLSPHIPLILNYLCFFHACGKKSIRSVAISAV